MSVSIAGISVERRGNHYRVVRTFPNGLVATLGRFASAGEAIAYATERVLELEPA